MATILFTAIGTLIGGPLGGVIGAFAGQQVDGALFGGEIQGPRLADLSVTTSAYGAALPRHFGTMRVAGTIIWASDLVEHSSTSGGKGSPSATSYSYTSSFAVALASRPLLAVGRVWANGNLLRGAAGDLKVGGTMRFYPGDDSQQPDAVISGAERNCPGFRGLSYVVFEDLALADFGNGIPAMTFEVFADDNLGLNLAGLFDGVIEGAAADVPLRGVVGYSCEGTLKATLAKFQPLFPMNCDADGSKLTIAPELQQTSPIALGEAARTEERGSFGGKTGFSRKRAPVAVNPTRILRYYDVNLDYQPGMQRAPGRPSAGQAKVVQVPAAMAAADALRLVSHTASNVNWARDTLAWRCAELDPQVCPGATVTVPGEAGLWRVNDWEWRAGGVELALERIAPATADSNGAAYGGAAMLAADLPVGPTKLVAYEVPWDGTGSADATAIFAAVSSSGAGWAGAMLYVDAGAGQLIPIGSSGRLRSTIGTAVSALAPASPLLFDRQSLLTVQLLAPDMALAGASAQQMIAGANRALIGNEFIQFGTAVALGQGQWQIGNLLRGRGGTEGAIGGHLAGDPFVLLDSAPVTLATGLAGTNGNPSIAALGLADPSPAESPIWDRGISLRPLSPVHGQIARAADGSLRLGWTRRARGAWIWADGVDVPLVEETEAYQVSYGPLGAPVSQWSVVAPSLALDAGTTASLGSVLAGGQFWVRQSGTYALSDPLYLGVLA